MLSHWQPYELVVRQGLAIVNPESWHAYGDTKMTITVNKKSIIWGDKYAAGCGQVLGMHFWLISYSTAAKDTCSSKEQLSLPLLQTTSLNDCSDN